MAAEPAPSRGSAAKAGAAKAEGRAEAKPEAKPEGKRGTAAGGEGAPAYAARFAQECSACHGSDGAGAIPGIPSLAGQHAFYAITQLFLFREGRRSNEAMSAVAKGMKDDDLRGFSEHIATLPAKALAPPDSTDPARLGRGEALARQHRCLNCHGDDLSGGQQVPRIGGQREDYLRTVLREFRAGQRPGYTMAMTEAVGQIAVEDLDTIAFYVARVRVGR